MNLKKMFSVVLLGVTAVLVGCGGSSEEIRKALAPEISQLNSSYATAMNNGAAVVNLTPKVEYKWGGNKGVKYSWNFVKYVGSGSGQQVILSPNSKDTQIRMMSAGTYQFKFRAEGDTIAWKNHFSEKIVNINVNGASSVSAAAMSFQNFESQPRNLPLLTGFDFSSSDLNNAWVLGTQNRSLWLTINDLSQSSGREYALREIADQSLDKLIIDLSLTSHSENDSAEANAIRLAELVNVGAQVFQQHLSESRMIPVAANGTGTEKENLNIVIVLSQQTSAYGELLAHMISRDPNRSLPVYLIGESTSAALVSLDTTMVRKPCQI
ncbi:hypothetical protein [Vibrio sonorensis]|uniref:hypothetical protein n=1 Tax=Vibrio sonorensis TaxID=1004316 RepID=UPI0008DAA14C|nr:hypothetical protein [Vibrio sonorensis]